MKTSWIPWKLRGVHGKFVGSMKTSWVPWKFRGAHENFVGSMKTSWVPWKLRGAHGNFVDSMKTSWRQCIIRGSMKFHGCHENPWTPRILSKHGLYLDYNLSHFVYINVSHSNNTLSIDLYWVVKRCDIINILLYLSVNQMYIHIYKSIIRLFLKALRDLIFAGPNFRDFSDEN